MKKTIVVIGIAVIVLTAGYWMYNQENWTLMVCDEMLNNAECFNASYIIPDFDSYKECALGGAKFSPKKFECGNTGRQDEYGLQICKEICNSFGCGN
jgi:hypothetical protein